MENIEQLIIPAARKGDTEDLKELMRGGAKMFAAMFGRNEVLKLLLAHGAKTALLDIRDSTH
jgi:hypothetical protein